MFATFFWDPSAAIWKIPYLERPILWYSLFFALGFIVGGSLFQRLLKKYFFSKYFFFYKSDILDWKKFLQILEHPNQNEKKIVELVLSPWSEKEKKTIFETKRNDQKFFLEKLNACFSDEKFLEEFLEKEKIRLKLEEVFSSCFYTLQKKSLLITDRLFLFLIFATVVGARLGHIIFYESFSFYLKNPVEIFKVWEGGLASHGAAVMILLAVFLFCFYLRRFSPRIGFLTLMDLIVIPVSFAGGCIRLGNFFNQEILGKVSSLPWAVQFGHPADGNSLAARHPVQLYEALFYLCVFFFLLLIFYKTKCVFERPGKIFGFFLVLVFTFRFLIEFLKEEQSIWLKDSYLVMGQYLSLPLIVLGSFLLIFPFRSNEMFEEMQ